MSQALALAAAQELRTALLDHGVKAVSIELQVGRGPASGANWWCPTFAAALSHHIVSRRSSGLTPGLALVKRGRTGLVGPLCNAYGGFDEVSRIITMGWANHPGQGGPTDFAGQVVPKDNGRPYLFGTEFEGGLDEADWTDEFHEFMARHNAGVLDWLGRPVEAHGEHLTWAPQRKIDRLHYTTGSGQDRIRAVLAGAPAAHSPAPAVPAAQAATYGPWYTGAPGTRTVRLYASGADVVVIQHWAGVAEDGKYGPGSVAAVKDKQKAAGLTKDGIVGRNTWALILAHVNAGANTSQTRATQGAVHVPADGKWGADTDKAVAAVRAAVTGSFPYGRAFAQTCVGTKSDGVWGTNSRAALARTVALLQAAWGAKPDGDWGTKTEAAYAAARGRNYMRF